VAFDYTLARSGSCRLSQPERAGQIGQRQFVRAAEHVDHDVVGAGAQVLAQPVGDVVGGAVGDQGVDELVTAGRVTSASVKPSRFQLLM
jgi:hypothetical protein